MRLFDACYHIFVIAVFLYQVITEFSHANSYYIFRASEAVAYHET